MAGLVPAIHVLMSREAVKTWMPATSAGMTGGFFQFGHSERPTLGYYRGRYVAVEDQARRGDPRAGDTKAIGAAGRRIKGSVGSRTLCWTERSRTTI